jgi:hypothetical protein
MGWTVWAWQGLFTLSKLGRRPLDRRQKRSCKINFKVAPLDITRSLSLCHSILPFFYGTESKTFSRLPQDHCVTSEAGKKLNSKK